MNNLKNHRKAAGLTQAGLAEKSGVNFRMVQKYENGENDINAAAALTVYKLSQALEVRMEELLEIENKPSAQG